MEHNSNIRLSERIFFHSLMLSEQLLGKKLFSILNPLKDSFLRSVEKRLAGVTPPSQALVDIKKEITPEEFQRDYFAKSRPVLFKAAARNWVCCEKWDLDYFKLGYAEEDLLLVNAAGLTSREEHAHYEFLTVRELIDNIKSGGKKYLRFSPILENNPDLVKDLNMDWLQSMRGQKTFANTYYMFMGGAGQKTLLHTDQPCNLYVQVYGEKKWTLYSSKESMFLYPVISNLAYVKSPIDVDKPDFQKFPLFKHAKPYMAHLEAGDVLYVPPHTWHFVENLTDTIAVGYRYSSMMASLRASKSFTFLRVFSTNPPIWKTMKYGKTDTNLIWAHAGGRIKEILSEMESRVARRKHFPNK